MLNSTGESSLDACLKTWIPTAHVGRMDAHTGSLRRHHRECLRYRETRFIRTDVGVRGLGRWSSRGGLRGKRVAVGGRLGGIQGRVWRLAGGRGLGLGLVRQPRRLLQHERGPLEIQVGWVVHSGQSARGDASDVVLLALDGQEDVVVDVGADFDGQGLSSRQSRLAATAPTGVWRTATAAATRRRLAGLAAAVPAPARPTSGGPRSVSGHAQC